MGLLAVQDTEIGTASSAVGGATQRVYIVDDNSEIRRSLHFGLSAMSIVAWPFSCAKDLLEQVDTLAPAPILLDVRMPEIDGIELLTLLRAKGIDWPVIMMSGHGDIPTAVQCIRTGAVDFLEKPFSLKQLDELLVRARESLATSLRDAEIRDAATARWGCLSNREAEVLHLLIAGARNKEVAHQLGISVRTVEIHRCNAMAKLDVRTLSQAALIQQSLIPAQSLGHRGTQTLS